MPYVIHTKKRPLPPIVQKVENQMWRHIPPIRNMEENTPKSKEQGSGVWHRNCYTNVAKGSNS